MEEKWTTVLKPKHKLMDLNLKELLAYKDLIFLFVKRNFVTKYKQTILGPLWLIISPILTTLMFVVVFGNIAGLSTDGSPQMAFYMAGNIVWAYFSLCVTQTSNTFVSNAAVFGKVYFPRLVAPISTVITGFVDFLIQFALFAVILAVYIFTGSPVKINAWAFATPLLILQLALLGMGVGIIVSSLTTKYRDLTILVTFGVQLWMYASPIVYSLTQIPEQYRFLYLLNPVSPIVTIFRYGFLGSGYVPLVSWGISWITTLIVVFIGVIMFTRIEKTFMDTV